MPEHPRTALHPLSATERAAVDELLVEARQQLNVDVLVFRLAIGKELCLAAYTGVEPDRLIAVMPANQGIAAEIMRTRQPFIVENSPRDPVTAFLHWMGQMIRRKFLFMSCVSVPVMACGEVVGIVGAFSVRDERRFNRDEVNLLMQYGRRISRCLAMEPEGD